MTTPVDKNVLTWCKRCTDFHRVPAFRVAPGLAVAHISEEPCKQHHREHWSVTHIDSGLALCTACCQEHAEVVAERVSGIADWEMSADSLRECQEELVEELWQAGIRSGERHYCDEHFWFDNPKPPVYPPPDWLGEREGES